MFIRKVVIYASVFCLLPALLWASSPSDLKALKPSMGDPSGTPGLLGLPGEAGRLSLLDPTRFSMSQSYSVGFSSDGKSGQMGGMYLNTIKYRFTRPISLQFQIGYVRSSALFGSQYSSTSGQFFIPNFELRYQPTKHILFTIRYQSLPQRSTSYSPWAY